MTTVSGMMIGAGPRVADHPLRAQPDRRRALTVITQPHPWWPDMRPLAAALENAADGDGVAYALALNTPLLTRVMTVATFRLQRWRAERAIVRGGGRVVAAYGVDPSIEQPSCFHELNTPAADYVDRCVRPRGRAFDLRRIAMRWFGCDPALGGVLIVGRKSCR